MISSVHAESERHTFPWIKLDGIIEWAVLPQALAVLEMLMVRVGFDPMRADISVGCRYAVRLLQ